MEIKLFNRWSTEGIKIKDSGLASYLTLTPKIVPKTGARYAGFRFHKSQIFIIERLINKLMNPGHKGKKHFRTSGHTTGKKTKACQTVKKTFSIIEAKLKKNPLAVFLQALENSAPREEIITIEYGGARYPKAVECSPQRRVDLVLRFFIQGAYAKSFKNKTPLQDALAQEIIDASQNNPKSHALAKKRELERQAASSK